MLPLSSVMTTVTGNASLSGIIPSARYPSGLSDNWADISSIITVILPVPCRKPDTAIRLSVNASIMRIVTRGGNDGSATSSAGTVGSTVKTGASVTEITLSLASTVNGDCNNSACISTASLTGTNATSGAVSASSGITITTARSDNITSPSSVVVVAVSKYVPGANGISGTATQSPLPLADADAIR